MKKCLVADNNIFYLEFFKDLLTNHGYEVVTAADGIIALELARKDNFDLFLFDYVMPKVDGIRLARYVREIDHYKETPIILITAAALESVAINENEQDIDIFVAKSPFDKMKELFNEVIPHIEKFRHKEKKSVIGLENIYPRQIVKELLVTELNYSVIFQSLVEGILELDENGTAIYTNKSFCNIVGKKEHEIIGHSVADIFDFKINHEIKDTYFSLKSHSTLQRESIVHQINGRIVHLSFYNIIGATNKLQGLFVIVQDVTEIRNKVFQISALFNITQAFLSNLSYKDVLQYVVYELRRLVNATNISIIFACNGIFKDERINAFERKIKESSKKKIEFWIDKIDDWKKSGLINIKNVSKLNKIKFDELPILWLPIIFRDTFLGTLIGFKDAGSEFDEDETRFFEAIGNQLAIYMANEEKLAKTVPNNSSSLTKVANTSIEDVIDKIAYLKWEERNKKNITKNLTERLNRNLTIIGSCFNILDKNDVFKEKQYSILCGNFLNSYESLLSLKDDIATLSKIGVDEESDFHVFSFEMLIKRLQKDEEFRNISFTTNIPNIHRMGDFEKTLLFIRIILCELLNKNAKEIAISFEDDNTSDYFNIVFGADYNPSFGYLLSEKWEDVTDNLYYAFWGLKTSLEFLNAKVTCTFCEEKYKISIIIPKLRKGELNEKV